jgi:hypothetical protein
MIDKKELKKKYKETALPMGIFRIKNMVNDKIFIGSSKNLKGKLNSIRFQLEQGVYLNKDLQKDFNSFGSENFSFEAIDFLEPKENSDYTKELAVLEQMWLEKLQPFGDRGYNKMKQ